MANEAVTFGEAMVLLLAEPGTPLRSATSFRRSVAGAESNVAVGLARLGHRVGWFGRVGADLFGEVVLAALRAEDVDVSRAIVDEEAPTGLLLRDCHPERPIEVIYHRRDSAGSRLSPPDVDSAWLAGTRLLHVTGITCVLSTSAHEAVLAAVQAAKSAGGAVSFDPNVRRKLIAPEQAVRRMRPVVEMADVVLAGADEAALLTGTSDRLRAAEWFHKHGTSTVILKEGASGAWGSDQEAVHSEPARKVTVRDPVGAGDAFAAGFLSGWLRGMPLAAAMGEAAMVAAAVVQVPTDIDGLPTAAERDAMVAGGEGVSR
jgi:2-dehydro-3-deoxygluconokinase